MYKLNPLVLEGCNRKKSKSSKKKSNKNSSKDKGTTYDVLKKNKLV